MIDNLPTKDLQSAGKLGRCYIFYKQVAQNETLVSLTLDWNQWPSVLSSVLFYICYFIVEYAFGPWTKRVKGVIFAFIIKFALLLSGSLGDSYLASSWWPSPKVINSRTDSRAWSIFHSQSILIEIISLLDV